MTYHRGFGQAAPDMVFSLTDPDVSAMQTVPTPTTTAPAPSTGGKTTSAPAPTGGKSGGIITSWAPQPAGTPITSATYAATPPSGGMPHWLPWAIGGGVAVLGLGFILAARN